MKIVMIHDFLSKTLGNANVFLRKIFCKLYLVYMNFGYFFNIYKNELYLQKISLSIWNEPNVVV